MNAKLSLLANDYSCSAAPHENALARLSLMDVKAYSEDSLMDFFKIRFSDFAMCLTMIHFR